MSTLRGIGARPEATGDFDMSPASSATAIPGPESRSRSDVAPLAREHRPSAQPGSQPSGEAEQAVVAAAGCSFAAGLMVATVGILLLQWVF